MHVLIHRQAESQVTTVLNVGQAIPIVVIHNFTQEAPHLSEVVVLVANKLNVLFLFH